VYGVGEIAGLGRAFDEMADAVDQREAHIDELNASLERRVEERTEELLAANSELESFSYTVSHDLRAPLRAIDGFSELLQMKYQADLPEDAHRFIERIRTGAVRMGSLIDDLLQFSRLTRIDLVTRPMSLDVLVREIVEEDFQGAAGEGAVEWRIGELGTAAVDPAMLRRVLVNLISNAVKFSRERTPAIIEIGRTEADGDVAYYVRDNGVGFDMAHASHMFGVFQRLHLQEEFEGTGIGLAIVERIIHRHDGRVWAESAPGEGATFYFTLGTESTGGE
jgi:light-regulated signal transduction histidine kinase (bacteriophytochrome)